jgi:hypothetical protein
MRKFLIPVLRGLSTWSDVKIIDTPCPDKSTHEQQGKSLNLIILGCTLGIDEDAL